MPVQHRVSLLEIVRSCEDLTLRRLLLPQCSVGRLTSTMRLGVPACSFASLVSPHVHGRLRMAPLRLAAVSNGAALRLSRRGVAISAPPPPQQQRAVLPARKRDSPPAPAKGQDKASKDAPKKVDSKTGGGDGEDGESPGEPQAESNPEDWLAPRATLFVCIMFGVSFVLWYLSQPRGRATGWATLKERVHEIDSIALYETYAQIRFHSGKDRKMYVGLVDPAHTQIHIDELRRLYALGKKKEEEEEEQRKHAANAAKPAEKKATESKSAAVEATSAVKPSAMPASTKNQAEGSNDSQTEEGGKRKEKVFRHAELLVSMRGRPMAEALLSVVGVFAWMVPFVFFPIYVMILSRSITRSVSHVASVANQAQHKAKMSFKVEEPSETRFRDVAGMKEPKAEITEIVDFLRHPKRYTKLGAKIPTGALLLGPPGTGKTLLAKAVSGESGVSFIPVCGSDFVELYAGMGAKRVRKLFELAKKQRCIIYIDEIDAIGLKRQGAGHGEKQEQEHTLNELLTQLDGFATEDRAGDVILLASSNVPLSSLDPALVRPGRFDRIIHVDAPVKQERIDIFKVHLCKLKLESTSPANAGAEPESSTGSKEETVFSVTSSESGKESSVEDKEVKEEESKVEEKSKEKNAATSGQPDMHSVKAAVSAGAPSSCTAVVEVPNMTADEFVQMLMGKENSASTTASPFDIDSVLQHKTPTERALIDTYAERMSELCPGFVGADVANVCNEAAILAAQEGAACVTIHHLERSIDRVLAGIEHRSRVLSDFEKTVVAHHEAGHAVAGWFLQRAHPLMKVSIVPRGGSALGYAQYLPNENRNQTAKELRDSISVTLGGRIAEQIFFQHLSTGASDDLSKVRRMAYMYVTAFGDNVNTVYPVPDADELRYRKPYGEAKADYYDEQAQKLVAEIYEETYRLLLDHKDHMRQLAEHLLKEEVLTHIDVVHYLGARPVRSNDKKQLRDLYSDTKENATSNTTAEAK